MEHNPPFVLFLTLLLAGVGCDKKASSPEASPTSVLSCVPGTMQDCPCDGVKQVCEEDSSGFSPCDCPDSLGADAAGDSETLKGIEGDGGSLEDVVEEAELSDVAPDSSEEPDTASNEEGSAGCGLPSQVIAGGVQLELDAGEAGDGLRGYWLSLPANYDPSIPHDLIVGYAGRDSSGEPIQSYFDLESPGKAEIFVYPDPLVREFEGWGEYGGWLLGEHAAPANGMADLVFTQALLDDLEETYCIHPSRVFVTGHSWGGDMAHVASCFLGDRFAAAVPVAANQPYWFQNQGQWTDCAGETAVWTFFGIADDAFGNFQSYPGDFGDQCRDFWLESRTCDGVTEFVELPYGEPGDCVEYTGCSSPIRYCLYGPATGHQIPPYYSAATMDFFRNYSPD